jgi:hypothetical protein
MGMVHAKQYQLIIFPYACLLASQNKSMCSQEKKSQSSNISVMGKYRENYCLDL